MGLNNYILNFGEYEDFFINRVYVINFLKLIVVL